MQAILESCLYVCSLAIGDDTVGCMGGMVNQSRIMNPPSSAFIQTRSLESTLSSLLGVIHLLLKKGGGLGNHYSPWSTDTTKRVPAKHVKYSTNRKSFCLQVTAKDHGVKLL